MQCVIAIVWVRRRACHILSWGDIMNCRPDSFDHDTPLKSGLINRPESLSETAYAMPGKI
jgi:hypothetical protein